MKERDRERGKELGRSEPKCGKSALGRHQRVVEQEFDEASGRLVSQQRKDECVHCGTKLQPSEGDQTARTTKSKRDRRDKGGETREE